MTTPEVIALIRRCKFGVEASLHPDGRPQAAVVGRCYLAAFPDGHARAALADCTYLRLRPAWVRVSDFGVEPPRVEELVP